MVVIHSFLLFTEYHFDLFFLLPHLVVAAAAAAVAVAVAVAAAAAAAAAAVAVVAVVGPLMRRTMKTRLRAKLRKKRQRTTKTAKTVTRRLETTCNDLVGHGMDALFFVLYNSC
jgi:hypothetical protein